jgi:uncharacterized protein
MGDIAVFGAGGRAGRAVTAEARARGHAVTAVVRDPARHGDLEADGVRLVRGDVTRPSAALLAGHDAVVHAVSPFSGPDQGLDALDPAFFIRAADALLTGMAATGVSRLVAIGLFATLADATGRPVMDDPAVFPPALRAFAAAHAAGLDRLRERGGTADWVMLTPPARLEPTARTGRYEVGGESVPPPGAHLSYADLAVAVLDEIDTPSLHRARVVVFRS